VACPASAADEPDLIFKRSTVFKWLTPNDKLATYGLDDPEVGALRATSPCRSAAG
jgi:CreA protein